MKMPRPSGPVRRALKILVAALMLAAITAAFFGVRACAAVAKVQLVPAFLAVDAVALVMLAVLIVLRGRLYCEIVCPLGIVQDFVRWIMRKKVRRVCTRLPETKRQQAIRWTVFALFLLAGLAGFSFVWLDPYAIFGRGLTLTGGLFFSCWCCRVWARGVSGATESVRWARCSSSFRVSPFSRTRSRSATIARSAANAFRSDTSSVP